MFSNIVYKINFNREDSPNCYIGSKSNCYVKDNKIFDKNNNQYFTSSTNSEVKRLIELGDYSLEVLYINDDYNLVLKKEYEIQLEYDVIHNDKFFNKGLATFNIFTHPDYVTAKINGEYKRVHRSYFDEHDCDGATKNMKWYHDNINNYLLEKDDEKISLLNLIEGRILDNYWDKNPFYGKKHSKETISNILESRKKFYNENPELYENAKKKMSENMKKVSQLPKSERFLKQIQDRGKNTLYIINIETLEKKRILKNEYDNYKKSGWMMYITYQNKNKESEIVDCTFCGKRDKINNSSFKKWHFENCKLNPINKDKWTPWLDVKNDEYKYYMYSKFDIIYDLYQENKTLSGKKLLPLIKNKLIDRELTNSEYIFFKRLIEKIKKENFSPLESENWKNEFRRIK